MPITVKKSKPRRIKTDTTHRKARLDYAKKMKNTSVRNAATKKSKLYYKKNRTVLLRKAKLNAK
jgi:hypothetical protein